MLLNEVLQGVQRQQDGVKSGKVTPLQAAVLSQDLASPQSLSLCSLLSWWSRWDCKEFIDTHPPSLKFYGNIDPLEIHFTEVLK